MLVDVPSPVDQGVGAQTAFMSQSHHILGGIRSIRYFQTDILHLHVSQRLHLYPVIDQTIETELSVTLYFKMTVLPGCSPVDRSLIPSGNPQRTTLQYLFAILCFDHEPHFTSQDRVIALIVQLVALVITGRKRLRQSLFRQFHRPSQPGDRLFL